MKNKIVIILGIILIINVVFLVANIQYRNSIEAPTMKVYSFEGKSEQIELRNGIIILSLDKNIFNGGNVTYVGQEQKDIKNYSQSIYIDHKNKEDTILASSVTNEVNKEGMTISKETFKDTIGYSSTENIAAYGNMKQIKNNLYYSLEGERKDGSKFNYKVKLRIKEVKVP